jgi:hypothetical protein
MTRLVPVAMLAAVLAGSAAGASAAPKQRWETCGERAVCATDDGGRHWRKVFEVPDSIAVEGKQILAFLRWSASAGVVSVDFTHTLGDTHFEFWTRDGGKHWWRTDVFDVGLGGTCASAQDIFTCVHRVHFIRGFASDAPAFFFEVQGQYVTPRENEPPEIDPFVGTYVLEGWTPRASVGCAGRWLGKTGRQLCWGKEGEGPGPPVNAGMSASPR